MTRRASWGGGGWGGGAWEHDHGSMRWRSWQRHERLTGRAVFRGAGYGGGGGSYSGGYDGGSAYTPDSGYGSGGTSYAGPTYVYQGGGGSGGRTYAPDFVEAPEPVLVPDEGVRYRIRRHRHPASERYGYGPERPRHRACMCR